jgi:tetratricopeptide (TPR) repeat protein
VLFYGVLKTKADILLELQEYDLAIRAYKKLKDFCGLENESLHHLRMKAHEQISVCYGAAGYYNVAITYLKKALQMSYLLRDHVSELQYYDKLSREYGNAGNPVKMVEYHKRAFEGLVE